jgi:hypothetical protein
MKRDMHKTAHHSSEENKALLGGELTKEMVVGCRHDGPE